MESNIAQNRAKLMGKAAQVLDASIVSEDIG